MPIITAAGAASTGQHAGGSTLFQQTNTNLTMTRHQYSSLPFAIENISNCAITSLPVLPEGTSFVRQQVGNVKTIYVTGVPNMVSSASTYQFTFADTYNNTQDGQLTITVNPTPPLVLSVIPPTTYSYTQGSGVPVTTPVATTGGTLVYTNYSISPALPPGIIFSNSTATFSGNPTRYTPRGTYTITVTDSDISTASANITLEVKSNIGIMAYDGKCFSGFYSSDISSSINGYGGTPPYKYTATSLPAGLSINQSTGKISGTTNDLSYYGSTTQYTYPCMVTVTDSLLQSSNANINVVVQKPYTVTNLVNTGGQPGYTRRTVYGTVAPQTVKINGNPTVLYSTTQGVSFITYDGQSYTVTSDTKFSLS